MKYPPWNVCNGNDWRLANVLMPISSSSSQSRVTSMRTRRSRFGSSTKVPVARFYPLSSFLMTFHWNARTSLRIDIVGRVYCKWAIIPGRNQKIIVQGRLPVVTRQNVLCILSPLAPGAARPIFGVSYDFLAGLMGANQDAEHFRECLNKLLERVMAKRHRDQSLQRFA